MSLKAALYKHILNFNFDVRTSRGAMKNKTSWFVKLWNSDSPDLFGIGECGPLPGLSIEDKPTLEATLQGLIDMINLKDIPMEEVPKNLSDFREFFSTYFPLISFDQLSSVTFAMETALLDLKNGGRRVVFANDFVEGKPIPINGLIWMGGLDFMLQQVEIKIRDGFRCLKLKVGGIDFEKECDVLQYIRRKYFRENITIRLDANGALKPDEAIYKLQELKRFDIHSIEQPLKPGAPQWEGFCERSPIPVALDESLIGVVDQSERRQLLESIRPRYIILKPTLHGGLQSCKEWIKLAEELNIGWWLTSALESNVGLNAIAQFTAEYKTSIHHGLGTGQIYANNIDSPLSLTKDAIFLEKGIFWDFSAISLMC